MEPAGGSIGESGEAVLPEDVQEPDLAEAGGSEPEQPANASNEESGPTVSDDGAEGSESEEDQPPRKKERAKDRRAKNRARTKAAKEGDPPADDLDPENEGLHDGPEPRKVPLDQALDNAGIRMDPEERDRFGEWIIEKHGTGGQHRHYGLSRSEVERLRNDVADFRGQLRSGR
jgi:hypothetical protein